MAPTFVFQDNGEVHAFVDGKLAGVASSADHLDRLEEKLAAPPPPPGPGGPPGGPSGGPAGPPMDDLHDDTGGPGGGGMKVVFEGELRPAEGGDADPLPDASPDTLPGDDLPPRATHITTPSGLKGTILGKTAGLWGDQVTVRLENGRIARFDVTQEQFDKWASRDDAKTASPYARMQAVLDAEVDPTESGLRQRIAALKVVKDEAKSAFHEAKYVDETTLHNIIVEADAQTHEVIDALEAMQQAEPYAPPETQVFEQESMGAGRNDTWLDRTFEDMMQDVEATDFDAEMTERPETLVAELETPALQDPAGVQQYAASYVSSKTAGLSGEAVKEFTVAFLGRVEACRKAELASRDEDRERVAKEASTNDFDGPAEGLFF